MGNADINTHTIEQYLVLTHRNQALGVVKPKIRGNVNFEFKSQFMRELRKDTFSRNKNDDAYEHVERILDIVERLLPGTINTQDLLKRAFIQRYYLPSKTTKQLEEIHNFKQEGLSGYYKRTDNQPPSGERKPSLTEIITKYMEESAKKEAGHDEWLKKFQESTEINKKHNEIICNLDSKEIKYFPADSSFSDEEEMEELKEVKDVAAQHEPSHQKVTPNNLPVVSYYVAPYEPSISFPRRLEQHVEEALVHKAMEILKKIKVYHPFLKEIRKNDDYAKYMKNLMENKSRTSENKDVKMNTRCLVILRNKLPPKEQDPGSFTLLFFIRKLTFIVVADLGASTSVMPFSMFKRSHQRRLTKENHERSKCRKIKDEEDLDRVVDYLKLKSHDGFIDIDDESYKERMNQLLGMAYKTSPPIVIKKVEVTRYTIVLGESYTKGRVLQIDELPRTSANVAVIRAGLIKEMDTIGSVQRENDKVKHKESIDKMWKTCWDGNRGNAYPYDVDFRIRGYARSEDLDEEPIEDEPLKEPKEEGIIRGCVLELRDSLFTIDLIPFGHGSFNVIVGIDWLSKHKARIVSHEKVVRYHWQVLRVHEADIPKTAFRTRYRRFEFTIMPFGLTNATTVFMDLLNQVCKPYLDKFVIMFIDDILIYSKSKEDHEHVVNSNDIHVDPSKIEAVRNWKAPKSSLEIRSFLGLASYCRCFIVDFSKIAKPLTSLTQNNKKYKPDDFMVYCDASNQGFECVLMQRGKVITYASRQLKIHEKNYTTHDLELGAAVENTLVDMLRGLSKQMKRKEDGSLYFIDRVWVPLIGGVRTLIMDEAHATSLTKSTHFLAIREDYKMQKLARLYIDEIVARHEVPMSIISDRDGRFTSWFWHTLQKALRMRLDTNTAYHPQTDRQSERIIQTLKDMLRACVIDFGGVVCFGNKVKLAPRYVGPFEIIERFGPIAYRLRLPQELSSVHDTFHVSNLNKDANLHEPLEEIKVDKNLRLVEEPVEIMDREVKRLKRSRIPIVKVRQNSKRGLEFTLERKDFMKANYPKSVSEQVADGSPS
uniref:Retrotransposon protein, putative, Ty3-gypsy subclass n=1 Tax=Tanacetum cinerariifolium TaxID=118510 RepID=A0A699H5D2_TANCI|nr:retrotransposon protein, putative, Ty3-gypsy subclass [Tanacetum cinerariifolium]